MTDKRTVRFAAVGLNHGHIYGQTNALLGAGAELAVSSPRSRNWRRSTMQPISRPSWARACR